MSYATRSLCDGQQQTPELVALNSESSLMTTISQGEIDDDLVTYFIWPMTYFNSCVVWTADNVSAADWWPIKRRDSVRMCGNVADSRFGFLCKTKKPSKWWGKAKRHSTTSFENHCTHSDSHLLLLVRHSCPVAAYLIHNQTVLGSNPIADTRVTV